MKTLPQPGNYTTKIFSVQLFSGTINAGFPSPAEGFMEKSLDLNELIVKHPVSTFFARVQGDSMIGVGIMSGDIITIDKSLSPNQNDIVVACIDGEFTVKRFVKKNNQIVLYPENPNFTPIPINPMSEFQIWGVVTSCIKQFRVS